MHMTAHSPAHPTTHQVRRSTTRPQLRKAVLFHVGAVAGAIEALPGKFCHAY